MIAVDITDCDHPGLGMRAEVLEIVVSHPTDTDAGVLDHAVCVCRVDDSRRGQGGDCASFNKRSTSLGLRVQGVLKVFSVIMIATDRVHVGRVLHLPRPSIQGSEVHTGKQ